jgi:hypothetical protein
MQFPSLFPLFIISRLNLFIPSLIHILNGIILSKDLTYYASFFFQKKKKTIINPCKLVWVPLFLVSSSMLNSLLMSLNPETIYLDFVKSKI